MQRAYGVSERGKMQWIDKVQWIKDHALEVAVEREKEDYCDLEPLRDVIGQARIVSLGESTYGTHEISLLKRRLVQFLIEDMGFTVFALSAPWAGCCALNDFVYAGLGKDEDLEDMMPNLGAWHWMTEEMLDLIYWLRSYNMSRPEEERVSFVGLDCLPYIQAAIDNVLLYVNSIDEEWAKHVKDLYWRFGYYDYDLTCYTRITSQEQATCRQQLQQVVDELQQQSAQPTSESQYDLYLEALQNARMLLQAEELAATQDFSRRELFVAENVRWLLTNYRPLAKMVIWSHNTHVALQLLLSPALQSVPAQDRLPDAPSVISAERGSAQVAPVAVQGAYEATMGTYLRRYYPDEFITIGSGFSQGSFYALDAQRPDLLNQYNVSYERIPEQSLEALFSMADLPSIILDLRGVDAHDEASGWLDETYLCRNVQKAYHEQFCWQPVQLARSFDLYMFVHTCMEAQLLPQVDEWVKLLPERPYNLDFACELEDWRFRSTYHHQVTLEPVAGQKQETTCLSVVSEEKVPERYFAAYQELQARNYLQKRIRLSACIRTKDVSEEAGLWLRVMRSNSEQPVILRRSYCESTQDRTLHSVTMDVPADSVKIILSVVLCGTGELQFDSTQFEVVGEDATLTTSDESSS